MSRTFWTALGLLVLALALGARSIQAGGADVWFGVLLLAAVPFFAFAMRREWRAARR